MAAGNYELTFGDERQTQSTVTRPKDLSEMQEMATGCEPKVSCFGKIPLDFSSF